MSSLCSRSPSQVSLSARPVKSPSFGLSASKKKIKKSVGSFLLLYLGLVRFAPGAAAQRRGAADGLVQLVPSLRRTLLPGVPSTAAAHFCPGRLRPAVQAGGSSR